MVDGPSALAHEEVVELGRRVEPEDVSRVLPSDAGAEMSASDEGSGVVCHPLEAVRIELGEKRGRGLVGGGGLLQQQQQGRDERGDLGRQSTPFVDERTGLRYLTMEGV